MGKINVFKAAGDDMALINRFTKKELSEDEVYPFSLVAADTKIDRDMERFSVAALEDLAKLYVGSTIITDHNPRADNQCARIYAAHTETDGEVTRLIVNAYMLWEGNEDLIGRIDAGIIKEVSVGCAVRKKVCSICGKNAEECRHTRGKSYGGQVCHVILDGATDAYEISFVAVPAQKEAGVIKCRKSFDADSDQGNEQEVLQDEESKKLALRITLEAAKIKTRET